MAGIRLLLVGLLFAGMALAGSVSAQEIAEELCPVPIQTCGFVPTLDTSRPEVYPPPQECPRGYECVCVPSGVNFKDCAARVCVRAPKPECKTACDCPVGDGCFQGQCFTGIVPVWCCDRDECPAGDRCDNRDGTEGRCEPRPNPMCELRVKKATTAVARIIEKFNRCDVAADCVPIDAGTQCRGACPELVNQRYARKASYRIDRVDRRICTGFREVCPFATPRCVNEIPACINHKCVGIQRPPPPRPRPIERDFTPIDGQILELEPRR